MLAPCKDCEERYLGCHSECEKYKAYRVQQEKISRCRRLGVINQMDYLSYKSEKTKRLGGKNE